MPPRSRVTTRARVVGFLYLCATFFAPASRPSSALGGDGSWFRLYGGNGGERINDVVPVPAGGYVAVGTRVALSTPDDDLWVLKVDAVGNIEWQLALGGLENEAGVSVAVAEEGRLLILGQTKSYGAGSVDLWVLKLGSQGNILWQNTYGGEGADLATSIIRCSDGGSLVSGLTYSFNSGLFVSADAWLLKLSPVGHVQWERTYGDDSDAFDNNVFRSVIETEDRGYLAVGYSEAVGGIGAWVLKLTAEGTVSWERAFERGTATTFYAAADTGAGFIVSGQTTQTFGKYESWVIELNPSGHLVAEKSYVLPGESLNDLFGSRLIKSGDGSGYLIAGYGDVALGGHYEIFLIKIGLSTSVQWARYFELGQNFQHDEYNFSIAQTPNGHVVLAGQSYSFDPEGDGYIAVLSPEGTIGDCGMVTDFELDVSFPSEPVVGVDPLLEDHQIAAVGSAAAARFASGEAFQICPEIVCVADLNGDAVVNPQDLATLLQSWGSAPDDPADFDQDGVVGPFDLATLLAEWGACLP